MISGSLCSSPLLSRVQAGMNCVFFLVSLTSLQFPDLIFCDYGSCGVTSSEMTMGEYKCTEQCYWLKTQAAVSFMLPSDKTTDCSVNKQTRAWGNRCVGLSKGQVGRWVTEHIQRNMPHEIIFRAVSAKTVLFQ